MASMEEVDVNQAVTGVIGRLAEPLKGGSELSVAIGEISTPDGWQGIFRAIEGATRDGGLSAIEASMERSAMDPALLGLCVGVAIGFRARQDYGVKTSKSSD